MSVFLKIIPRYVLLYKQNIQRLPINDYSKCYSTQQAIKSFDDDERNKQLMKDAEKISNIYSTKKSKKPAKPPFLKNTFLGKFDTDILTFPQLDTDELKTLNANLEPTQNYFNNLPLLQTPPDIKSDFMENLKQLKLFGLQGPQTLEARGLNVTEDIRFNDVMASNTSAMMGLLCNDKLVSQAILKHGSEAIKQKYLPSLIAGNIIGGFCVSEPLNTKEIGINTTAKLSTDKKTWVINGKKSSIVNGNTANLLLVLAKSDFINPLPQAEPKLTLFIVEKDFGGVTTEACQPLGLQATDFANINFNNTPVPAENILGLIHNAELVLPSILTDFRLAIGPACAGIMRQLINQSVEYCTHIGSAEKSLADVDYIQSILGQLTIQLYAIESMNYLTSSLIDQYENQDYQMEAIAVKIFSTQQTVLSTGSVMEMLGSFAYMKDHWCNALHRDALSYLILHEPSENLKLTLSLLGLQYTGVNIQEKVKKFRNPLFHPADIFKRMWSARKQINDDPKLILGLPEYLHPSLKQPAEWLEYSILRLEYTVECMLIRLGQEIINSHMELLRLADCVIDIYAMTACLGRASRSYCIGLAHADTEMVIAHTFCFGAVERIREKLGKICKGPYFTNDENYKKISKHLFKEGKYFPVHPLTRNY